MGSLAFSDTFHGHWSISHEVDKLLSDISTRFKICSLLTIHAVVSVPHPEGELAGVQGCSTPPFFRNGGAAPPFFEGQSAQIS